MAKKYIVRINDDCWLASWDGDPGRTLVRASAKRFTKREAEAAIAEARRLRPKSTFTIENAPAPSGNTERSE